jgi:hypothetical protein
MGVATREQTSCGCPGKDGPCGCVPARTPASRELKGDDLGAGGRIPVNSEVGSALGRRAGVLAGREHEAPYSPCSASNPDSSRWFPPRPTRVHRGSEPMDPVAGGAPARTPARPDDDSCGVRGRDSTTPEPVAVIEVGQKDADDPRPWLQFPLRARQALEAWTELLRVLPRNVRERLVVEAADSESMPQSDECVRRLIDFETLRLPGRPQMRLETSPGPRLAPPGAVAMGRFDPSALLETLAAIDAGFSVPPVFRGYLAGSSAAEVLRFLLVYSYCPTPDTSPGKSWLAAFVADMAPFVPRNSAWFTKWSSATNYVDYGSGGFSLVKALPAHMGSDWAPLPAPHTAIAQDQLVPLALEIIKANADVLSGLQFWSDDWAYDVGDVMRDLILGQLEGWDRLRICYTTSGGGLSISYGPDASFVAVRDNLQTRYNGDGTDASAPPAASGYSFGRGWVRTFDNCSPAQMRRIIFVLLHEIAHVAWSALDVFDSGNTCECLGPAFVGTSPGAAELVATKHWYCSWIGAFMTDAIWEPDRRRHPDDTLRRIPAPPGPPVPNPPPQFIQGMTSAFQYGTLQQVRCAGRLMWQGPNAYAETDPRFARTVVPINLGQFAAGRPDQCT